MAIDGVRVMVAMGTYGAVALFVIALCYVLAGAGRDGVEAVRYAGMGTAFAALGLLALALTERLCLVYGYPVGR
jgi:hypothetical protein